MRRQNNVPDKETMPPTHNPYYRGHRRARGGALFTAGR